VFRTLLHHIYCEKIEGIGTQVSPLSNHFSAIRASKKYLMPQVTASLVRVLKSRSIIKSFPGRIYAFACTQDDFPDLVDAASKNTLRCGILNVDMDPEGGLITGRQYQDLVDLHRMRTRFAVDLIDSLQKKKDLGPLSGWGETTSGWGAERDMRGQGPPERAETRSHFKCSCNKDVEGPPLWLFHFCTNAKMELNRAPVSENVFSGMAVLEILQDIPCRDCASSMRKYWPDVLEVKASIDRLPTSIKR